MRQRKYPPDHPMVLACKAAILAVGGRHAMAKHVGRGYGAIAAWEVVPEKLALKVSRLTNISVHVLRPDVFGASPQTIPIRPIVAAKKQKQSGDRVPA